MNQSEAVSIQDNIGNLLRKDKIVPRQRDETINALGKKLGKGTTFEKYEDNECQLKNLKKNLENIDNKNQDCGIFVDPQWLETYQVAHDTILLKNQVFDLFKNKKVGSDPKEDKNSNENDDYYHQRKSDNMTKKKREKMNKQQEFKMKFNEVDSSKTVYTTKNDNNNKNNEDSRSSFYIYNNPRKKIYK